jgi:hypothetical protein
MPLSWRFQCCFLRLLILPLFRWNDVTARPHIVRAIYYFPCSSKRPQKMPSKQVRPRRPRSDIAQVYPYPRGPGYSAIRGIVPLKSGLTPITLGPNVTPRQEETAENIRWIQRLNLYSKQNLQSCTSTDKPRFYGG